MKRLAIYLIVTFGLTWGTLIPAGIALGTFENGEGSSVLMLGFITVSMFFPLVGALVSNLACKPDDRLDLGFKPRIRENLRHYAAALLVPSVLTLLGCMAFFALNPQLFDASGAALATSAQAGAQAPGAEGMSSAASAGGVPAGIPSDQFPLMIAATIVSSIVVAPFINMIPAFGEELGWRGMLFPALAERLSKRNAALVSGVIWGLWHAPAIAMGHNYGMGYAGFPIAGIATMTLACTALGCWLALLRLRTKSVWPCALAHGAFNAVANVGLAFCMAGQTLAGPSPLGLVAGIPLFVFGAICWLRLARA